MKRSSDSLSIAKAWKVNTDLIKLVSLACWFLEIESFFKKRLLNHQG